MNIKKYIPNPLSITSSEMSPNMLLMAKVIVIGLLLKGYVYGLSDHFLPLIPIFDYFGPPAVFEKILQILFLLSSAGILFNIRVRLCCVVLGIVLLTVPLSSMVRYRNSVVFCGFLFLFTGIHRKGETPWLVHYQIAILYFGAGLNKLLNPDWQSGRFFEHWMHAIIQSRIYLTAAAWFPPMVLSKIMCWSTFIIELGASISLITRRFIPVTLGVLVFFHSGAMILSGDFGIFTIAILASFLSFIDWPAVNERKLLMNLKQHILYSPLFYMGIAVFLAGTEGKLRSVTTLLLILLLFPYSKIKNWIMPRGSNNDAG